MARNFKTRGQLEVCMVCGRVMRTLTVSHLRNHGIDYGTYRECYEQKLIPMRAVRSMLFIDLDELALSGNVEIRNMTLYQMERLQHMQVGKILGSYE